jgi:glycosyltransferase involved in cell wall biosynthesis
VLASCVADYINSLHIKGIPYTALKGLGLNVDPKKPLVAVVSRLVPQKGIHLIKSAVYRTVQQGGQFVLLGRYLLSYFSPEYGLKLSLVLFMSAEEVFTMCRILPFVFIDSFP